MCIVCATLCIAECDRYWLIDRLSPFSGSMLLLLNQPLKIHYSLTSTALIPSNA